MEPNRPSRLSDVAKHAGVSVATASRVLNGSPHRVSDELAEKVRASAADLRYAPNVQAQGLARSSSSVVALLLHDLTDPYFGQIAQGVLVEAERRRIRVVIAETGIDPDNECAQLASLGGLRPRAAIVVGSRTNRDDAERRLADALEGLRDSGTSVVTVGQPGLPGGCVQPSNKDGAAQLARHLYDSGHRRFAVVAGPEALRVVAERRDGFCGGLARDAEVEVIGTEFSRDGGYAAGRRFARDESTATAVFVSSDVMAGGFCTAIRQAGMEIPQDVSVAGFDDVPLAADLYPPLTTVRLPLQGMGEQALNLALDGPDDSVVSVSGELVVRSSVALR